MAIEEEEDCDECLSYDGTQTIIPLELPKIMASPVLLVAHLVLIIDHAALLAIVKCMK